MEYIDIDLKTILEKGKRLGSKSSNKNADLSAPILYDGLVYKFFLQSPTRKEKLILQLEKLHLKYLSKIQGLFRTTERRGFIYQYSTSPLLAEKLGTNISFQDRLKYISGLIATRNILDQNGLLYFDYHSENFLAGKDIEVIDIDNIISNRISNRVAIDRYFIELLLSIFMNFDISINGDNSYLYDLFYKYFDGNINLYGDEFDMDSILNIFAKMNEEDALELQNEVLKVSVGV